MPAESALRLFHAMIWVKDPDVPGKRVTVWAIDLDDALAKLSEEYGNENVYSLHNKEDADKPR